MTWQNFDGSDSDEQGRVAWLMPDKPLSSHPGAVRSREWRKNNPERAREKSRREAALNRVRHPETIKVRVENSRLLRTYGIDLETFKHLSDAQNGLCALCGRPPDAGRKLCVDHDHVTGKIRSLLCDACNFFIGHLEHPLRAAGDAYIASWKAAHEL